MEKRDFLKISSLGAGGILASSAFSNSLFASEYTINDINTGVGKDGMYVLPPLKYDYNALEPYIDEQTMRLHHDKHHQGYVNGLNKATKKINEAVENNDFSLIKHWQRELAFHGAGHFLHVMFWNVMTPKQGKPSAEMTKYIDKSFGSWDNFKNLYKAASKSVEGSGWGILAYQPNTDKLVVLQVEKHQNFTQWVNIPLIPVDVWEHAYYLKYQNKRGDYIDAFFNVIDWEYVSEQFDKTLAMFK